MSKSQSMASRSDYVRVREARATIRSIHKFFKEYDPPVVRVPEERTELVHTLWGWAMWLIEQGLVTASLGKGSKVIAAAPLVRSVQEHAVLMLWLSDVGAPGMAALHAVAMAGQRNLWRSYKEYQGRVPDGVAEPEGPPKAASPEEAKARQELKYVEQRMKPYLDGTPYYVYRILSGLTHPGLGTARTYAPVDDDHAGKTLHNLDQETVDRTVPALIVDCAIHVCFSVLVLAKELKDERLTEASRKWCRDLGVDDSLPQRSS